MRVSADFVCDHDMPKPWATCIECMLLPAHQRPEHPAPTPAPRKPNARPGLMPKTAEDPIPDLIGDRDVSYPVWSFVEHMEGEGNDWLFGEQGFPWGLRQGGWIYLRSDGVLGARVRVKGIGFREVRREHTGDEMLNLGPGPTIEVDPSTWDRCSHELGDLAERQRQGYRYLITTQDGKIEHLMADMQIPPELKIDPPSLVSQTLPGHQQQGDD